AVVGGDGVEVQCVDLAVVVEIALCPGRAGAKIAGQGGKVGGVHDAVEICIAQIGVANQNLRRAGAVSPSQAKGGSGGVGGSKLAGVEAGGETGGEETADRGIQGRAVGGGAVIEHQRATVDYTVAVSGADGEHRILGRG